jgi:hypothetical protein
VANGYSQKLALGGQVNFIGYLLYNDILYGNPKKRLKQELDIADVRKLPLRKE